MNWNLLAILLALVCGTHSQTSSRTKDSKLSLSCDVGGCFPTYGDLMIGREHRLSASSTCGMRKPERYCIFSGLDRTVDRNKCFVCDSRNPTNPRSHRVENIISRYRKDWESRWWQSENGVHNVSLQLDLEAEFHFTFLTAKFKSIRPAGMVIERSFDFGKTWQVYKEFSTNCTRLFPTLSTSERNQRCDEKQTRMFPSSKGEIYFAPIQNKSFQVYSKTMQTLLKVTNLRINFTKLHSLDDQFLTSQSSIKQFYSVYQLTIQGRCSCYGHASTCGPVPGEENNHEGKVHGKCVCAHFTKGHNCEQCQDFYNDLPWAPATKEKSNTCQKCNCNMHSMKCHFDAAVYVITNYTSGGVCDDCQHNTQGYNCEQCKPFFYHDPMRSITDPYACQSCDCDPNGSLNKGECEPRTVDFYGVVAGACNCKLNVFGKRCDTCKDGFWNIRDENPDGCEACNCHPIGTIVEAGTCDQYTGECKCKRFVGGKQCDKCLPGYWNFSEQPQGCTPCDCDIGGAADWNCDQLNGGCQCRPNIIGRYCNEVPSGYFVPGLDWLIYEAEYAKGHGSTYVENREPYPGGHQSWTGPGFMRVYEKSLLEFDVKGIPFSTQYDIIIRYESHEPGTWSDVTLSVLRPEPTKLEGPCGNVIHTDQSARVEISDRFRHYILIPTTCLERGSEYKIQINFDSYSSQSSALPGRTDKFVLVDSIILVPSADQHPTMQFTEVNNIRNDYERYHCINHYLSPAYQLELPEACRKIIFSASAYIHDGAQACDCDPIGSDDTECDAIGGQCSCKPNVIGRRCDQCAYAHYGFGRNGCTACKCNLIGSLDNNCDVVTGQCKCIPNAYGLRCGECQRGFFGYPRCQPCQCNGMSEDCDGETGQCLACRDNTGGHNCERCADGFYGDPRSGCRPCMCPGGEGSGAQHARTCHEDRSLGQVVCHCDEGYIGLRCDRCTLNYYGDPVRPGGTCQQCSCNGNIDLSEPESCDSSTGECLKCLYNTYGYNCNRCRQGYFGDAVLKTCRECDCNVLGTNQTHINDCDPIDGQCQCLPNVMARKCDQCKINHWKLYGGEGCIPCECDLIGSEMEQCDVATGQCYCKPGRGGVKCSECPAFHWGTPALGCKPCSCNSDGSTSRHCDKFTGQCICQRGVTGLKCDHCDRGTTGQLPYCQPCGECFDNYDELIHGLGAEIGNISQQVASMKLSEKNKAYKAEFSDIEENLEDLEFLTKNMNGSFTDDLIKNCLDEHFINKTKLMENVLIANDGDSVYPGHDQNFSKLIEDIEKVKETFDNVKKDHDDLLANIKYFKDNAKYEQEQNIEGAHKSIMESKNSVDNMQHDIPHYEYKLDESAKSIQERDEYLNQFDDKKKGVDDYDDADKQDTEMDPLDKISQEIVEINKQILDLNFETCGGKGETCDDECGGADCKECGSEDGNQCLEGSVTKSNVAFKSANESEQLISNLVKEAEALAMNLFQFKRSCSNSEVDLKKSSQKSQHANNESESNLSDITSSLSDVKEFLEKEKDVPVDDLKLLVNSTLDISIKNYEPELEELSVKIKTAAHSLEDVQQVNSETKQILLDCNATTENAIYVLGQAKNLHSSLDKGLKDLEKLEGVDAFKDRVQAQADKIKKFDEDVDALTERVQNLQGNITNAPERLNQMWNRLNALKESNKSKESKVKEITFIKNDFAEKRLQIEKNLEEFMKVNETLSSNLEEYNQILERNKNNAEEAKKSAKDIREKVTNSKKILQDTASLYARYEDMLSKHGKYVKDSLESIKNIQQTIQGKTKTHFQCR